MNKEEVVDDLAEYLIFIIRKHGLKNDYIDISNSLLLRILRANYRTLKREGKGEQYLDAVQKCLSLIRKAR